MAVIAAGGTNAANAALVSGNIGFSTMGTGSALTLDAGWGRVSGSVNLSTGFIQLVDSTKWEFALTANTWGTLDVANLNAIVSVGATNTLSPTGVLTSSTGGTLRLNNQADTAAYDQVIAGLAGNVRVGLSTGAATLTLRLTVDQTHSGAISNAISLLKSGPARQTFQGGNTFTGTVQVTDGSLRLDGATALGGAANVIVENAENPMDANNNTLELHGGHTFGTGASLTLRNNSTSNLTNAGTRLISSGGSSTWAGNIVLDGGLNQALAANTGATLNITGSITQSLTPSNNLFIRGEGDGTISSTANLHLGGASLTKTALGIWTINSTGHTWGDTHLSNGTLRLGIANALPTDTSLIIHSDGTEPILDLNGFDQQVADLWINGVQQPANTYDENSSSFITGSGSLTVTAGPSAYENWAAARGLDGSPGKELGFDEDPDGDTIANGLEWVLGGDPLNGASGPLVTTDSPQSGGLSLSFTRNEDTIHDTNLEIQYSADPANSANPAGPAGPWSSVTVGTVSSGPDTNGVSVTIDTIPTPDQVTVTIPAVQASGGKFFGRLKASQP